MSLLCFPSLLSIFFALLALPCSSPLVLCLLCLMCLLCLLCLCQSASFTCLLSVWLVCSVCLDCHLCLLASLPCYASLPCFICQPAIDYQLVALSSASWLFTFSVWQVGCLLASFPCVAARLPIAYSCPCLPIPLLCEDFPPHPH